MGLFSRKPAPPAVQRPVVLPTPFVYDTDEECGEAFEEVGELQRGVGYGDLDGFGEAVVARIEGAVIHYLHTGSEPEKVFDVVVAPISEWAMSSLVPVWLMPDRGATARAAGAKHAYDIIIAFREKYQHLNPANN